MAHSPEQGDVSPRQGLQRYSDSHPGNRPAEREIWDAESGQEILTLRGHTNDVFSVSWSPDGRRLASGSVDNTLTIWDAGKDFALKRE